MIRIQSRIKKKVFQKNDSKVDYRKKKLTPYAVSLAEKQKLKFAYDLSERKFSALFKKSRSFSYTNMNLIFLQSLFFRLDSLLVSVGIAKTFRHARQLISHRKILVNNLICNKSSYTCLVGDIVSLKNNVIEENFNVKENQYLEPDLNDNFSFKIIKYPVCEEDINWLKINMQLIVEFYNKY